MRKLIVAVALVAACKSKRAERDDVELPPSGSATADRTAPPPTGLAEVGPHPDYPTAAAAGTDKLFFLEEPDRGPPAPAAFALPAKLDGKDAAYCDYDALGVACGTGPAGAMHWRVSRKKGTTIAQRLSGASVMETVVWVAGADGKLSQRLHLDALGNVDKAYLFNQPDRYTGRTRSGENALNGCGMFAIDEDAQHRIAARRCLQWLGEPMRDKSGVAVYKYAYDAHGFIVDEQRFGLDGQPVDDTTGVHRIATTRDAAGRTTIERYFSAAGARATNTSRCAGLQYTYADTGAVARATCIAADDAPTANAEGVTTFAYRYDAAGCPAGDRYLDARGEPIKNHNGIAGHDTRSDAHCFTLGSTCLAAEDKPVACGAGRAARTENTLDERGRVVTMKSYDADGQPVGDVTYSAPELRYTWDDAGNKIALDCFDENGDPIECGRTGFHGWRMTHDGAGRELVETFVGSRGERAMNMGTSQRRFHYDNYDHLVTSENLDADGKLVQPSGYAVRKNLWDATHRLFAVQLLDADGKPASYKDCFTGSTCPKGNWQAVRINRRPNGAVITNEFFDADGQLIATIKCGSHPCFDRN